MPWQRLIADIGGELLPGTTIPAYREIIVTIPRQNGKTTLTLAFECDRAVAWGSPQRIAYTAQSGKDAREKLLNDQAPILTAKGSPFAAAVSRVYRGVGNESIQFKTGSRIFVLNSGEDSGHGKTVDLGVIDESFADEDDRREQAMLPAMLTRAEAQMLNISTAGTEKSVFLKRKVDAGRAAVANDERQGIAYFEWAADPDLDPDDPATWWSCMPALGYTITEEVVRHARLTMTEGEFRRSMLNQWTVSEERVIPAALWNDACSETVAPEGRLCLGLDVNPERSAAALAVADEKHRGELVEFNEGVGWLTDRAEELAKRWNMAVVLDGYGPAASFAPELEARGVQVHTYTTRDMARACGVFYDAVADGVAKIRRNDHLDLAAAAARKRTTGDTWIWGRRDSNEDVTPLVALTIAYEKAASRSNESELWVSWA